MSEEKMRTEFEDYFSDYGECPKAIERGSSGAYSLLEVCIAWPAWQVATASKQREIAELSAQVEVMREALEKIAKPEKLQSHGNPVVLRICALDALRDCAEPSSALLDHDNDVAAKAQEEAAKWFSTGGLPCTDAAIDDDIAGNLRRMATERRNRK